MQGYQLQPGSKILATNATQILRVVNCAPATGGPDDLAPLVNTCEGIYDGEVVSPATVSAKMKLTGSLNSTVVSNITITDLSKYTGTVNFSSMAGMAGVHVTDGMAQVTWTLIEDLPDVRTYTASGTISAGLAPALQGFTCIPVPVSDFFASLSARWSFTAE